MRPDAVVFDLDGTLVDSSTDIAWAANRTLEAYGYGARSLDEVVDNIGWGARMLLKRLMPEKTDEEITTAREAFLEFYGRHLSVHTTPYPGVEETLEGFGRKGKRMAVVTNKPAELAERLLKDLGMESYFDMVVGGDTYPNRKPHPEPLERVLEHLGVLPASAVFIGDSPVDCQAGRSAGARTIGVTYGFRGAGEISEAGFDALVDSFAELGEVID